MSASSTPRETLQGLLDSQPLAVLCTTEQGGPYASLVAFAATPDLAKIIFATTRHTRKYANLLSQPRTALLIDNRSNQPADFRNAVAATATGVAREVAGPEGEQIAALFLARHATLAPFVQDPATALFCVDVERYRLVERFQQVVDLDMHA